MKSVEDFTNLIISSSKLHSIEVWTDGILESDKAPLSKNVGKDEFKEVGKEVGILVVSF